MSFSSSDSNALLRRAAALHQAGNLPAAISLYRQLLPRMPDYPLLLNMLGTAELQSGNAEEGVALLGKSLAIESGQLAVLSNRGCGLLTLGRAAEALGEFDRAIALNAGNAEAHCNRGNALKMLGRPDEALAAYGRAIACRAGYAEAYFNRGALLAELKRPAEALADYDRALAQRPDYAKAHNNRAGALIALGRPREALAAADRAIAIVSDYAAAHGHRGSALAALRRHQEAVAAFDRAIALSPEEGGYCYDRGNAYQALKQPERALADYERALALGLDDADTLGNRGAALIDLGRTAEALAGFDALIARFPDHAPAHFNRGCILYDDRKLEEAAAALGRALELAPDFPEAQIKLAMLELLTGDFASGWARFEWRWQNADFRAARRNFSRPLWLGDAPLAGKKLLIHAEQGFGDTVQFSRYAPLAGALGADVIFEVPQLLQPLLSGLKGEVTVVAAGEALPEFDLHCPVMSLPLAFKTTLETVPADIPYLDADPGKLAAWRQKLGEKTRPRVGLMWSGRLSRAPAGERSIALPTLAPLLALPCEFHCLQKDIRDEDTALLTQWPALQVHPPEDMDFAGTAALIEALDLVVSVDTSVAHIAGALGKPLWLLLPWAAEWRWLLDRSDSPWYPSATLFRQPAIDDWDTVIAEVAYRLRQLCNGRQG